MNTVHEMLQNGFALIPIPRGQKGPRVPRWNERENVITDPEDAYKLEGLNVGLAHAYCSPSPTCAIDIDDLEIAQQWLVKRGIAIEKLCSANECVACSSGIPGHGKFFFWLPHGETPLPTQQITVNGKVVLEFRCASKDGKTMQDVLPPSIHPSGAKYEWLTEIPISRMATLPDGILQLWKEMSAPPRAEGPFHDIFENVPDYIKELGPSELTRRLAHYGQPDRPSLRLIETECAQVREALQTGGANRAEPLWRGDLGLIKHTDGGNFACHEASHKHPSYSHEETEEKIESYKAGPTTCEHYQRLNPEPCSNCRHHGRIKSPIVLGRSNSISEPEEAPTSASVPGARKPFKVQSAEQLLSKAAPPRESLLTDLLPRRIIAGLVAPGGTGKSMLALQIGAALSGGTSLFGQFFPPTEGTVVYLSGEDDQHELHRRLDRIVSAEAPRTQQRIKENLFLLDRSEEFDLFTKKEGFGEATITQVVEELASAIRGQISSAIDLLIVDPAARFRGGDENSASDVNRFIQALYLLKERLGCTVLVLHHVNKGAKGNGASQNNARGSSAFSDGVRMMLELNGADTPDVLVLSCVKSNYGRRPAPITLLQQADGTFTTSSRSSHDIRALAVLREIEAADMTKNEFKRQFGKKTGKLGLSDRELRGVLDHLVANGLIEVQGRKPIRLTPAGERWLGNP